MSYLYIDMNACKHNSCSVEATVNISQRHCSSRFGLNNINEVDDIEATEMESSTFDEAAILQYETLKTI